MVERGLLSRRRLTPHVTSKREGRAGRKLDALFLGNVLDGFASIDLRLELLFGHAEFGGEITGSEAMAAEAVRALAEAHVHAEVEIRIRLHRGVDGGAEFLIGGVNRFLTRRCIVDRNSCAQRGQTRLDSTLVERNDGIDVPKERSVLIDACLQVLLGHGTPERKRDGAGTFGWRCFIDALRT